MPTPVEVSCVRRSGWDIEALGGTWNWQPWSMSAPDVIAEIERPGRQWDFFIILDGEELPITIRGEGGRKSLCAGRDPIALFRLPEIPREKALGWEV
jgi:hypothetical protein